MTHQNENTDLIVSVFNRWTIRNCKLTAISKDVRLLRKHTEIIRIKSCQWHIDHNWKNKSTIYLLINLKIKVVQKALKCSKQNPITLIHFNLRLPSIVSIQKIVSFRIFEIRKWKWLVFLYFLPVLLWLSLQKVNLPNWGQFYHKNFQFLNKLIDWFLRCNLIKSIDIRQINRHSQIRNRKVLEIQSP